MSDLASSFTILWASQTGNAEWIAKNIFSEAKQRGYSGECFAMEEWEKVDLSFLLNVSITHSLGTRPN